MEFERKLVAMVTPAVRTVVVWCSYSHDTRSYEREIDSVLAIAGYAVRRGEDWHDEFLPVTDRGGYFLDTEMQEKSLIPLVQRVVACPWPPHEDAERLAPVFEAIEDFLDRNDRVRDYAPQRPKRATSRAN